MDRQSVVMAALDAAVPAMNRRLRVPALGLAGAVPTVTVRTAGGHGSLRGAAGLRWRPMERSARVRVELLGPFDFDLGAGTIEVTVPVPATMAKLLEVLATRAPGGASLWRLLSGEDPERRRYCYVSVDYEVIAPDRVLETPLDDGARVCFGMPMAGG